MAHQTRVFIASVATETNTFSPLRTDLQDFKDSFYAAPGAHPVTPTLCSAVFPAAKAKAKEFNWEIIEGTASWAEPGGLVNQQTWEFLRDQLLAELKAAMPVDIVLLGLHGAMVSQDCLDCEGELLKAVRAMTGPDVIIGVTFDPHSHLSSDRVENADLITVFKEFPHTDFVDVAEALVKLAHETSTGKIKPQISTFDCKMIEILPTSRQPMRGFVDKIKAMEGTDNVLSVSVVHGFMAGNVPDLGCKIIVITNDDKANGDELASRLGAELFSMRGKTRPEFLDISIAFEKAVHATATPVVIADVWDNPGGGVPGDSTFILRSMMDNKVRNAALASIWDPIAVRTCFSAGEGAQLRLRFGAKMSEFAGDPIDADVIVRKVKRNAVQSFGQSIVPIGDAAWIEVGGVDVILNSVRSQVFNPDIFSNMGIDPKKKALLVVKSTNHFHDAFSRISPEILYVAIDGPYPNNPVTNNYTNLERQIWPRVENPHG
ncbi:M81 family metallopeptidase [Ahrensia marina]|uniref:Microcystinase C n=1 Tax=Ahrensia marina TaxID=1514904 RepID=A0A0M9GL87_9HYPH|nr:M81 family metallopeptidase [Ahrensia marina]KPB00353.1 microcystin LR degradation protein MlrC-like protein [Ahrensia marina]